LTVKRAIWKNALRAAFCECGAFDWLNPPRRGDTPRLSKTPRVRPNQRFHCVLLPHNFELKSI
jgi:hypothetical protein